MSKSNTIMNREESSDSIPNDNLIPDILSRLPAKSIARFRCVSKLWGSLLCKPYFKELFLSRSSVRPRLLIGVKKENTGEWFFFSSSQPQNPYEKSSLVVTADFHMKISSDLIYYESCRYASGLLYFPSMRISKEDKDERQVICNPSTGQRAILPEPRTNTLYRSGRGFLGFDPIDKQFKVLYNNYGHYHILTLGTEKLRWRTIQSPSYIRYNDTSGNGICINGILYYLAQNTEDNNYFIVCFDVRLEKFKTLGVYTDYSWSLKLINYKGKLGVIELDLMNGYVGGFPLKLHMWVLEDIEKRKWSLYAYTLRTANKVDDRVWVVGVTASGEIVLAKYDDACEPFYVFYFNPERNTLRSVEIQGIRQEGVEWSDYHEVYAFVDHVEDLNFDVTKTLYAAANQEHKHINISEEDHQVSEVRCSPATRSGWSKLI